MILDISYSGDGFDVGFSAAHIPLGTTIEIHVPGREKPVKCEIERSIARWTGLASDVTFKGVGPGV